MLFVTKGKEKEMGFVVTQDLVKKLKDGLYDAKLKDIYVDEKKISYERNRYIKAVESYTVLLAKVRYLSLVQREEARLVEIIQTINVERCWRRPSTMMRLLLCRN